MESRIPEVPEPGSSPSSLGGYGPANDEALKQAKADTQQLNFMSFLAGQEPSQMHFHNMTENDGNAPRKTDESLQGIAQQHGDFASLKPELKAPAKSKGTTHGKSATINTSRRPTTSTWQPKMPIIKPINLRKSADKKVVGLKDFGATQSTRNIRKNEWLSSSRSIQSDPNLTIPSNQNDIGGIPASIPVVQSMNMPSLSGYDAESPAGQGVPPTKINPSLVESLSPPMSKSVEELEERARRKSHANPFHLLILGNIAALKVMGFYLITLETCITCALTVGMTMYWYNTYKDDPSWSGNGLDFVLLAFAVTTPMSAAIGMAFQRRERALIAIADFRSFSYHLYMVHCLWDWSDEGEMGREKSEAANKVVWLEHCDAVLAQLLGIGDELSRFLTLPTASKSRHRMTATGRREASRTMEVAYQLIESMTTQRLTRLIYYSERLKKLGLPAGEISRVRQYERFISDVLEQLRMVKLYRTPQALRSFARIFTILLPPFYAPVYAQVARETDSLGVGIFFGIITALALTALFESMEVLEDPFTAFLALDGIDAREEFEVLHFSQMTTTRRLVFPNAPQYPAGRRAALTHSNHPGRKLHTVGMPPMQGFHAAAATAAGSPYKTLSVNSGISMDKTTENYLPTTSVMGVTTAATGTGLACNLGSLADLQADTTFVDEELGIVLPVDTDTNSTLHNRRVSVFDDERVMFGVTNDDEDESRHLRLRRRSSTEHTPQGNISPTSMYAIHTSPPSMAAGGDGSVATARPSPYQHRRTRTNLSAAGLVSRPPSRMRLPDC